MIHLLGDDFESKRFQKVYQEMWERFIRSDGKYTNKDVTDFINSLAPLHKDEIIRTLIMKLYMEHMGDTKGE